MPCIRRIGLALVATIAARGPRLCRAGERHLLYARVPMQRSLDSLEDRARDLLSTLGYPADGSRLGPRPRRSISTSSQPHLPHQASQPTAGTSSTSASRRSCSSGTASSPQPLVPFSTSRTADRLGSAADGARHDEGELDDGGLLVEFEAVPPFREDPISGSRSLRPGRRSSLPLDSTSTLPACRAADGCRARTPTERAAWQGPLPKAPDQTLRVEAAAHRGMPVFFRSSARGRPIQPATTSGAPARAILANPGRRGRDARALRRAAAGARQPARRTRRPSRGRSRVRVHHDGAVRRLDHQRAPLRLVADREQRAVRLHRVRTAQCGHDVDSLHRARALRAAVLSRHPHLVDAGPRRADPRFAGRS